ncbi:hypothetical protein [Spirillospora sp. CA-294931]|uniref:hypothetical protein n=1 Tax=Spirillospora sp. CA-294931 TaxID=3240042 RepID=UPI003D8C4F40
MSETRPMRAAQVSWATAPATELGGSPRSRLPGATAGSDIVKERRGPAVDSTSQPLYPGFGKEEHHA